MIQEPAAIRHGQDIWSCGVADSDKRKLFGEGQAITGRAVADHGDSLKITDASILGFIELIEQRDASVAPKQRIYLAR